MRCSVGFATTRICCGASASPRVQSHARTPRRAAGHPHPEILQMQARAILDAACDAKASGGDPQPEIMVPLTSDAGELVRARAIIEGEAAAVFAEREMSVGYQIGTMVETPRAALTAHRWPNTRTSSRSVPTT